jgi:hypothetical protein
LGGLPATEFTSKLEGIMITKRAYILVIILAMNLAAIAEEVMPTLVLTRVTEGNERAFTVLVPKGWITEGGIFRIDPMQGGGAGNALAAKVDFAVKSDAAGTETIRWLPDMLYFDSRYSPAGQMGLMPPGSNNNGMLVWPVIGAAEFISQFAIPYSHPQAQELNIIDTQNLTEVARKYHERRMAFAPQSTSTFNAALVTVTYIENGARYKEKIVAIVEDWGALGAGIWGNKETFYVRAPVDEFDEWQPVFSLIQSSVEIDEQWLIGEIQGQVKRGEIAVNTQAEINRIGQEIANHRGETNAEIHNDMFLTLTEQEEYVNPYTKEVETGSNQWDYRWVNQNGDVIYCNEQGYDPNNDINLNTSGFKRTPVRERGPK